MVFDQVKKEKKVKRKNKKERELKKVKKVIFKVGLSLNIKVHNNNY